MALISVLFVEDGTQEHLYALPVGLKHFRRYFDSCTIVIEQYCLVR